MRYRIELVPPPNGAAPHEARIYTDAGTRVTAVLGDTTELLLERAQAAIDRAEELRLERPTAEVYDYEPGVDRKPRRRSS